MKIHPIENLSQEIINSPRRIRQQMPQEIQRKIYHWLDMDYIVTDWKFSNLHATSTKVGYLAINKQEEKINGRRSTEEQKQYQRCICCLNHIDKIQIPLCDNVKQLKFLGPGFPLFYIFLKNVLMLLLMLIASYTILEIYWAITNNYEFCIGNKPLVIDHHQIKCTSYMVLFASITQSLKPEQKVLRITSFCITVLFMLFLRDNFEKIILYYDQQSTNYSHFSILIQNLPTKVQIDQDPKIVDKKSIGRIIREFLNDRQIFSKNNFSQDGNFEPKKILLIAKNEDLQHETELRKKNIEKLIKIKGQMNHQQQNGYLEFDRLIHQSNVKIRNLQANIKKQIDQQNVNCDKAIVCFQEEEQRVQIENQFQNAPLKNLRKHFGSHGNKIILKRAPLPSQIEWENIDLSRNDQFKLKIISWIIFIVVLGSVTTGFYFVKTVEAHLIQQLLSHTKGKTTDYSAIHKSKSMVYGSIVFIIIFNKFILAKIIHHLVQFERHKTASSIEFSFCLKYTLGLFFTTALMTLLVQGVTTNNIYKEDYGVVEEQTIMYFFNSFIVPAIWLINPWHIAKWIKRKIYYGTFNMTQGEANKLMENPEYIIGKRYGEVLENVWFTYLYVCIIPAGSVLIFIGMSLFYWIDKCNLLRRSSVTVTLGGRLVLDALNLLQVILILKPAGELIFDNWLRHEWSIISVIELILGFLFVVLPTDKFLLWIHPQPFQLTYKTYDMLQMDNNIINYEFYHPVTKMYVLAKKYNLLNQAQVHKIDKRSRHPHPCASTQKIRPHETETNQHGNTTALHNFSIMDMQNELQIRHNRIIRNKSNHHLIVNTTPQRKQSIFHLQ